ncbi:MAG: hypothetical protein ACFE9T_00980 [Promethearchaeota archaeon]
MVLIVAFFMYFQKNPVFTIVIVLVAFGTYLFIKSKQSGSGTGMLSFLSGKQPQQQNSNMDDLITLVMLQQLLNSSPEKRDFKQITRDNTKEKEEAIEKTKNEILELLKGD